MSKALNEAQEEQKKFGLLLLIRWIIFFFAITLTALKIFTNPSSPLYYSWLLGLFLLINLVYSFLYLNKAPFPVALLSPAIILDFLIISAVDFLSGGLTNHFATVFYLFLISGSSILVSYRFSFHLALATTTFNSMLFFLHSYKLYPSNLLLLPKESSIFFNLFSSFFERETLIATLIFFERYFLMGSEQKVQKLQKEKERVVQALEGLGDGLLLLDDEGKVLSGNYQVEKLIGAKISAMQRKIFLADPTIFSCTLEFFNNSPIDWINEVKKVRAARKFEFKVLLPLEERHILVTLAPIKSSNKITGMVALLENISEAKRLEEMKSDFLSTVSHELRTPLTTVKGYVSLLLNPKSQISEEKKTEFLQAIEKQADNLAQMINELLDVSRLEAGQFELKKQLVQLKTMIEKVIVNLHPRVRNRTIEVKLPPELPPVFVDPDRTEQVFTNLIDNALKYSPADKPVIIEGWKENEKVVVMVQDFGPGIAPAEIPHIFEKFHRVDRRLSREIEGTGLGLYIAKNLIEAHGGEIWVESQLNQGSKFFVALPISHDNSEI